MNVATTILAQLGGNKFVAMTGAKAFGAFEDGLQFRVPGRKINCVRVRLNGRDLYDVEFWYVGSAARTRIVERAADVDCSDLVRVFESATGLYASL